MKKELLDNIFRNDTKQEKGIIDSESAEEFLAKVESVSEKWEKLEESIGKQPKFSEYFQRHMEEDMKNGMLLPVRRRAGLNDEFYYNNSQESSHASFKGKIKENKVVKGVGYSPDMKCSWSEAINLYKGFVSYAKRDVHRVVLGKGPYSLATPYSFLAVSDAVWSSMPWPEREKHLEKLGTSVNEAEELTEGNDDAPRIVRIDGQI